MVLDPFLGRITTGSRLIRSSIVVLIRTPKLLVFPLGSIIVSLSYLLALTTPFLLFDVSVADVPLYWTGLTLAAFTGYLVTATVLTVWNAALIHATGSYVSGNPPSILESLRSTVPSLGQLVGWAALVAIVGVAMRVLQRLGQTGSDVVAFLWVRDWTTLTYFAAPQLLFEETSIPTLLFQKGELATETWGDSFRSGVGVASVIWTVTVLTLAVLLALSVFVVPELVDGRTLVLGGLVVLTLANVWYETISSIVKTVLYGYARTGVQPYPFTELDLDTLDGLQNPAVSGVEQSTPSDNETI